MQVSTSSPHDDDLGGADNAGAPWPWPRGPQPVLSNISFLHDSIEEKIEDYQENTGNKMDENDSEPKR